MDQVSDNPKANLVHISDNPVDISVISPSLLHNLRPVMKHYDATNLSLAEANLA
jgi:hypothetical protein